MEVPCLVSLTDSVCVCTCVCVCLLPSVGGVVPRDVARTITSWSGTSGKGVESKEIVFIFVV